MLFKREGYPEEDELVLCTISKVQFHSVFCDLDEYKNQSGMIHISEVSPGRIRNIRDYVKEGKKVVCLILRVDLEKGHIDLSLRRVNESQKRRKLDSIKQEQKAEKIIELLAQDLKKPLPEVYKQIADKILEEYDMMHLAFDEVVEADLDLKSLGLEKSLAEKLTVIIHDKIKPKEVEVSGDFKLSTYAENGLEIVKTALMNAEKVSANVDIKYEGGGKYSIKIKAKEYKEAEAILKKAKEEVLEYMDKNDGQAVFERHEK